MYRAAATATAAAAAMSRSTSSAMRRQVARCGGGGEQRYWSRGFAAKDVTVARAAVKEERTLGVEIRARAAGTEDGTFRVAIQRCVSDLRGDFKTPKEVAFGVGARAAMLNNLADDVKNSSYTSFRLDARPALSDLADTIDLQGIVEELAKEDGANLASTNKPARHVNNTWAPHGHGHPATQVGICALRIAGMSSSCAARKLKGGFSNVYSRPYSGLVEQRRREEEEQKRREEEEKKKKEEEEEQKRREEEEKKKKEEEEEVKRREEEERKMKEEDGSLTFLLFVKRLLESILKRATKILSVDIKFTQWEKTVLSCVTLVGALRLALYKIMDLADSYFEARIDSTFMTEETKFEAWKTEQELKRARARTAAAIFRASEAECRRQEIEQLAQLEERWLSDLGHSLFKLRTEILDLKSTVSLLQRSTNE